MAKPRKNIIQRKQCSKFKLETRQILYQIKVREKLDLLQWRVRPCQNLREKYSELRKILIFYALFCCDFVKIREEKCYFCSRTRRKLQEKSM